MEIKEDSNSYDTLHEIVLRKLFASIKGALDETQFSPEVNIPDEFLEGVIETIAFNVAAVFDGNVVMEHNGKEVKPFLAFKKNNELIVNDAGSYLHEMVMWYLEEHDLDDL